MPQFQLEFAVVVMMWVLSRWALSPEQWGWFGPAGKTGLSAPVPARESAGLAAVDAPVPAGVRGVCHDVGPFEVGSQPEAVGMVRSSRENGLVSPSFSSRVGRSGSR